MVIAALAAITITGCDAGRSPLPCNCPNLIQAMDSVDWAPDKPVASSDEAMSESGVLDLGRSYSGFGEPSDAENRVETVRAALEEAGLGIETGEEVIGRKGDLEVRVWAGNDGSGGGLFLVRVLYDGEDSPEIAELLAPVGPALEALDSP
jgi:hypothetical protein